MHGKASSLPSCLRGEPVLSRRVETCTGKGGRLTMLTTCYSGSSFPSYWVQPFLEVGQLCFDLASEGGSPCFGKGPALVRWGTSFASEEGQPYFRDQFWLGGVPSLLRDGASFALEGVLPCFGGGLALLWRGASLASEGSTLASGGAQLFLGRVTILASKEGQNSIGRKQTSIQRGVSLVSE